MVVGGGGIESMSGMLFSFPIPAPADLLFVFSCMFSLVVPYRLACNDMVALGVWKRL